MATESELIELLGVIGDHAPSVQDTLDRLTLQAEPATTSHRRWLPIGAAIAAVAATVVVAVAVRGDDPNGGGTPAAGAAPQPTVDRATYPLPLDDYYASDKQRRILQRAEFVLAQRCAQARGVTVPDARIPADDAKPAFLATVANNVRPLTLQQARTIGYDLYKSGHPAIDAVVAGLTPQQLEIFEGWNGDLKLPKPTDPLLLDGGCYEQAQRTLLTDAAPGPLPSNVTRPNGQPYLFDDDVTVNNVYLNAARTGETSPEVRQAQKRWSACMTAHGYPSLHTTEGAIQSVSNLRSASAKRMAVQDVLCKQSTGFMSVWIASITKAQQAVIAANEPELEGFKKRLAIRMNNAAKALK